MPKTEKTYQAGPVRITKHPISFDDAGWDEFGQLTVKRVIDTPLEKGLHYFNPQYTLFAEEGQDLRFFLKQVRRALVLWYKRIDRTLGRGVRRRALKQALPHDRPFIFTGVLIVDGKQIHPNAWRQLLAGQQHQA